MKVSSRQVASKQRGLPVWTLALPRQLCHGLVAVRHCVERGSPSIFRSAFNNAVTRIGRSCLDCVMPRVPILICRQPPRCLD